MTVAIRLERGFVPGNVTPLFKTEIAGMNPYRTDYEPAPDGNRFIIKAPVERKTPPSITVVLNWLALLRH
jgi:hypothetical protein